MTADRPSAVEAARDEAAHPPRKPNPERLAAMAHLDPFREAGSPVPSPDARQSFVADAERPALTVVTSTGKRRKSETRQRTVLIGVRCTPEEAADIRAVAAKYDTSPGALLRGLFNATAAQEVPR